jgi:hypothetical protein
MARKNNLTNSQIVRFDVGRIAIIGRRRAISTSKIKKITAIRKNRRENGSREDLLGSNPHSKGDLFSRSVMGFLDKIEARPITTVDRRIRMVAIIEIIKIIYPENIQSL